MSDLETPCTLAIGVRTGFFLFAINKKIGVLGSLLDGLTIVTVGKSTKLFKCRGYVGEVIFKKYT